MTHQRDVHRSHTDQRIRASFKPHEALRKTLQKPDPASRGNDATAGMPSAGRSAAEVQAAPLKVMEREAEQTVGIDRLATEVQDASPVIERKGIPNIGTAVGRALIAVMETYQQQGGSIAVPLVRIVMLVAGFGIYLLFVIRVVIPLVCHTRL